MRIVPQSALDMVQRRILNSPYEPTSECVRSSGVRPRYLLQPGPAAI